MLKIKELNGMREVVATKGYVVRKGETPTAIKRRIILPSESLDDYEEVLELPAYTEAEYKAKVRELIAQRYSIEDELAIHRQKETKQEQWAEYDAYCEECKTKAKEALADANAKERARALADAEAEGAETPS